MVVRFIVASMAQYDTAHDTKAVRFSSVSVQTVTAILQRTATATTENNSSTPKTQPETHGRKRKEWPGTTITTEKKPLPHLQPDTEKSHFHRHHQREGFPADSVFGFVLRAHDCFHGWNFRWNLFLLLLLCFRCSFSGGSPLTVPSPCKVWQRFCPSVCF